MATPTAMATRTTGSRSSKLLVHLHQRQICTSGRSCRRRLPLPPRTLQVASEISEIPDVHPRHRQCSSCPLGGTWQEPSSRRPSPSRFWVPSLGIGHHTADHLTSIPEVVGEETQYPWTSTTFNVEGPTRPANPVTAPSGRRTGARPSRKLAGSVSTFPMGRPIGSTPFAAGSGVAIWSRIPTGSPKLGDFSYGTEDVIRFPQGIAGFEQLREFVLLARDECDPFIFLAALEQPEVALPLVPVAPGTLDVRPSRAAFASLGQRTQAPIAYYAVASIRPNGGEIGVNLRAPIVINLDTRLGCQVILPDETLPMAAQLPA